MLFFARFSGSNVFIQLVLLCFDTLLLRLGIDKLYIVHRLMYDVIANNYQRHRHVTLSSAVGSVAVVESRETDPVHALDPCSYATMQISCSAHAFIHLIALYSALSVITGTALSR